jgi:hypothetical protein
MWTIVKSFWELEAGMNELSLALKMHELTDEF